MVSKMPPKSMVSPSVCTQDFRTPLMEAAIHNAAELVELLIQADADIDALDPVSKQPICSVLITTRHSVINAEVTTFVCIDMGVSHCGR